MLVYAACVLKLFIDVSCMKLYEYMKSDKIAF